MVSPYAEFTVYHPRPGLRTAAEIRRQKTRRQEGSLGCHIPPPSRGGGTDRVHAAGGGVVPRPAVPARSRVPTPQGAVSSPRHTVPLGCGAAPWAFCRSQLSTSRDPDSSLPVSTRPRSLRPLLPAPAPSLSARHWSNRERCSWFFSAGVFF